MNQIRLCPVLLVARQELKRWDSYSIPRPTPLCIIPANLLEMTSNTCIVNYKFGCALTNPIHLTAHLFIQVYNTLITTRLPPSAPWWCVSQQSAIGD